MNNPSTPVTRSDTFADEIHFAEGLLYAMLVCNYERAVMEAAGIIKAGKTNVAQALCPLFFQTFKGMEMFPRSWAAAILCALGDMQTGMNYLLDQANHLWMPKDKELMDRVYSALSAHISLVEVARLVRERLNAP